MKLTKEGAEKLRTQGYLEIGGRKVDGNGFPIGGFKGMANLDPDGDGKVEISTADLRRKADGSMGPSQTGTIDINKFAKDQGYKLNMGDAVELNPKITKGNIPKMDAFMSGDSITFQTTFNGPDPSAMARATAGRAMMFAMNEARNFGTAPMRENERMKNEKSMMERWSEDGPEDDSLPFGPGYAMMTHLFNRSGIKEKAKGKKKQMLTKGTNIFTDAMESVKTAMQMVGLYSETNVGGLPFDLQDAMKAYFGDKQVDDIMKSQFIHDIQDGVTKIDPKKVRKFVNKDGSLTWEILNDDKTVMNRFTYGKYNGTNIFAQGGYNAFAEMLKKAMKELGPDVAGEFDAMRDYYK